MRNKFAIAVLLVAVFAFARVSRGGETPGGTAGDLPSLVIYDPDPTHLWNRLHRAFFLRPDTGGEASSADTVDPPLWPDTSGFLKSGPSHRVAISILDEFLADDGHALVTDPLKRAVLQHDLWSVFDWAAAGRPREGDSDRDRAALRSRLARAIGRLALTPEEVASLPDNFSQAVASDAFSPKYDPGHPRKPFLPSDLFDPDGPWVCVRGAVPGPSAPVHVRYYRGRSPFLVFVRLPGARKATLGYLKDLNRATGQLVEHDAGALPQFPVGTMVALVRQMTAIDTSGTIRLTPLTQTVQMRVYRQVGTEVTDHKNSQTAVKFRLERAGLFAGRHGGLEAISWEEPLRVSLIQHNDPYDDHARGKVGIDTVMQSCIACHSCGGATVHSVFTYKQDDWVPGANAMAANRLRLTATVPANESKKTIDWKMARYEWGLLKGSLDQRPTSAP